MEALVLGLSLNDLFCGLEPFFTTLLCFLDVRPVDLSLVSQKLFAGLQLVDVFHENPLVFEHVTLHF